MNKIFSMQPRQSGKTYNAILEYKKDPQNTIYVVTCNSTMSSSLFPKCITTGSFKRFSLDKRFKNIILDEYMFFENKEEIYNTINNLNIENLFIYSTSDKIYSKELFDFIKNNKLNYSYNNLLLKYQSEFNTTDKLKFDDLYYNFITDYDTNLIEYGICSHNQRLFNLLEIETYNIEILNWYLQ